jgi:hypothetical protein
MKVILAGAIVALASTSAFAQRTEPYANTYQDHRVKAYQENRDKFMTGVSVLSYARHCGVIANYNWHVGQKIIELLALQTIGRDYPPDYPLPYGNTWITKFRADVGTQWKMGAERTKQDGCDFWKENPDAVYAIRETAARVSSGIGDALRWFPSLQDANNRGRTDGPTLVD